MDSEKLKELVEQVADTLKHEGNSVQFEYKDTYMACVYDTNANRMRIISPIVERSEIGEAAILNALVANFHSALDVKYALSDEIIWSVFIHPLQELSETQVLDAIDQVHRAAITFGSTYSSTDLVFPGNFYKEDTIQKERSLKKL